MAKNGEVTYELRGDDSKLENDLNKADQKVLKSAKKSADDTVKIEEQKTREIKAESEKVVRNADKAAGNVADAWKEAGEDAEKAMRIQVEDQEINIRVDANTSEAEKKIESLEADDMEVDVDADTGKAEAKIKDVSKDKSIDVDVNADNSDAKEALKELGDAADDVGEKIKESIGGGEEGASAFGNIGKALSSSFSDAAESTVPLVGKISELTSGLSGTQVAAIGTGAAVVGIGAAGVSAANDMQGAMNDFLAVTGKSREETEKYQGVLESIYNNNYGESFGDIAAAMASVTQSLGDMDDASLQNVTESAFALRDTFGYDIPESTRAAKAMMDNFGISGEDAMNMIAAGAQNGLDYSGELMDSISEYSVQFAKVGLDADDMFSIFQKGAESGAFNLDKVGDAVKEMSIRVIDGSDTTKEGFETIGLNADEMAQKFAAGGDTAKEAFQQTIDALAAMEDPIAQNMAGVDLFGTMWEDLGPEAVTALSDIQEGAYETSDAMEKIKDVKYDDLGAQFEELKRNVETAVIPIGEALIPLLMELAEEVLPVLTGILAPLIDLFVALFQPITTLIRSAITPLIDLFMALLPPINSLIQSAIIPLINIFGKLVNTAITPLISTIQSLLVPVFTGALSSLLSSGSSVINNIINIFRSLIDFVKNVFTGNWRAAWQNVKDIFSNAVSGLASIFKAPINAIVDGWNKLSGSLGSITIPEWVPAIGGNSWSLPKLSRLKVGLDYVPHDMFPAFLDEGEWVLTKEEANLLRSFGGLEGMAGLFSKSPDAGVNVTVKGNDFDIDYEKFGKATADAMIHAGVGFKCDERTFARLIEDLIDYV